MAHGLVPERLPRHARSRCQPPQQEAGRNLTILFQVFLDPQRLGDWKEGVALGLGLGPLQRSNSNSSLRLAGKSSFLVGQ